MDAIKKWLAQYRPLRAEAYRLVEEMDVLKENPSSLARVQFQTAENRLNECLAQIEEIEAAISALDDPQERLVLRYRYTDTTTTEPRTWREIAQKVYGKDNEAKERATHRINQRALEHLAQVLQRQKQTVM